MVFSCRKHHRMQFTSSSKSEILIKVEQHILSTQGPGGMVSSAHNVGNSTVQKTTIVPITQCILVSCQSTPIAICRERQLSTSLFLPVSNYSVTMWAPQYLFSPFAIFLFGLCPFLYFTTNLPWPAWSYVFFSLLTDWNANNRVKDCHKMDQ